MAFWLRHWCFKLRKWLTEFDWDASIPVYAWWWWEHISMSLIETFVSGMSTVSKYHLSNKNEISQEKTNIVIIKSKWLYACCGPAVWRPKRENTDRSNGVDPKIGSRDKKAPRFERYVSIVKILVVHFHYTQTLYKLIKIWWNYFSCFFSRCVATPFDVINVVSTVCFNFFPFQFSCSAVFVNSFTRHFSFVLFNGTHLPHI